MSKLHKLVAFVLALSVFAILVSPLVPSELTTLLSPQQVRPHWVAVPLALYAPATTWFAAAIHATRSAEAQLVLPGSEVVLLTCARLC